MSGPPTSCGSSWFYTGWGALWEEALLWLHRVRGAPLAHGAGCHQHEAAKARGALICILNALHRGTASPDDVLIDANITPVPLETSSVSTRGKLKPAATWSIQA